jgi:hypothetical protein
MLLDEGFVSGNDTVEEGGADADADADAAVLYLASGGCSDQILVQVQSLLFEYAARNEKAHHRHTAEEVCVVVKSMPWCWIKILVYKVDNRCESIFI